MLNWDKILKGVIRNAGTAGVLQLEQALDDLKSEAKEPWKGALLRILSEAVSKYGLEGVGVAEKLVDDVSKGKMPGLDFVSLKARSDYLATLQNMEADERDKANDFMKVIGKKIGVVLRAILSGVLG